MSTHNKKLKKTRGKNFNTKSYSNKSYKMNEARNLTEQVNANVEITYSKPKPKSKQKIKKKKMPTAYGMTSKNIKDKFKKNKGA